MKTINETFSDEEHATIKKAKGNLTYRMWMIAVAKEQLQRKGDY